MKKLILVTIFILIPSVAFCAVTGNVQNIVFEAGRFYVTVEVNDAGDIFSPVITITKEEVLSAGTLVSVRNTYLIPRLVTEITKHRNENSSNNVLNGVIGQQFNIM